MVAPVDFQSKLSQRAIGWKTQTFYGWRSGLLNRQRTFGTKKEGTSSIPTKFHQKPKNKRQRHLPQISLTSHQLSSGRKIAKNFAHCSVHVAFTAKVCLLADQNWVGSWSSRVRSCTKTFPARPERILLPRKEKFAEVSTNQQDFNNSDTLSL